MKMVLIEGAAVDLHDFYGYKLSRTNSHQAVKQDKQLAYIEEERFS